MQNFKQLCDEVEQLVSGSYPETIEKTRLLIHTFLGTIDPDEQNKIQSFQDLFLKNIPQLSESYFSCLALVIKNYTELEEAEIKFSRFGFSVPIIQFLGQFHGLKLTLDAYPDIKIELIAELKNIYPDSDTHERILNYLETDMESLYVPFILNTQGLPEDLGINIANFIYKKLRLKKFSQ